MEKQSEFNEQNSDDITSAISEPDNGGEGIVYPPVQEPPDMAIQTRVQPSGGLPAIPAELWDKYEERLKEYQKKREQVTGFIKENLEDNHDFGFNYFEKDGKGSGKKTLLKAGADKIKNFIMCEYRLFPDYGSWKMLGEQKGVVCYISYLIDREILTAVMAFVWKFGMKELEPIIKMLAWGEGRGACATFEKTYGSGNIPIKGSENRAIKVGEKRAKVNSIISTLALDVAQDEEYTKDGELQDDIHASGKQDPKEIPQANMEILNEIIKKTELVVDGRRAWTAQEAKTKRGAVNAIIHDNTSLNNFKRAFDKQHSQRIATLEGEGNGK